MFKLKIYTFQLCEIGHDPKTLILKLDLYVAKMSNHTKNELSVSIASNSPNRQTHAETKTQMDRQTDTQTL